MSVYAYATPMYIGISTLLCCSYCCIESTKHKGKLKDSDKSLLLSWCVVSIVVACVIMGVSGEMMVGMTNMLHLLVAILLACITLGLSSYMVYAT
jgi:hypothetical protein